MWKERVGYLTALLCMLTLVYGCGGSGNATLGPTATVEHSAPTAAAADGKTVSAGYKISGRLRYSDGTGIPNAAVEFSDYNIAYTDVSGNYTRYGAVNGTYTLTPKLTGHAFDPPSKTVVVNGADLSGINFIGAYRARFSGFVRRPDFQPVAGVTVKFWQGVNQVTYAVTDAAGYYSASGLPYGDFVIRAEKAGYWFTPESYTISADLGILKYVNFIALDRYYVAGYVHDLTTGPVANVTLSFTKDGQLVGSVVSGNSGYYFLAGLENGTYTITPSKQDYNFTPPSREVTINNANVFYVNFNAYTPYSIRGTIRDVLGQNMANVTVNFDNGGGSTTTNQYGMYSKIGLAPGSYTVTPSKMGFGFTPASKTVVITNASAVGINFYGKGCGDWNQILHDPGYTNCSNKLGPGQVNHYYFSEPISSSASGPLIAGDNGVYLADSGNNALLSLAADCSLRWAYQCSLPSGTSFFVDWDGTIYIDGSSQLLAVSPDGTLEWSLASGPRFLRQAQDGSLSCISDGDIARCNRMGFVSWDSGISAYGFLLAPDGGFLTASYSTMTKYAFDGAMAWQFSTPVDVLRLAIAQDGSVYCRSDVTDYGWGSHNDLTKLTSSGTLAWTVHFPSGSDHNMAVGKDGAVYIDYDTAIRKYASDGTLVWTVPNVFEGNMVVDAAGNLYFVRSQAIVSVDANGNERWSYPVPNLSAVNYWAISDNKGLYATAYINSEYRLIGFTE